MIRGVLWDVGNVIVRWDPRTLYSKVFEEPAEVDRFLSSICTMEWHLQMDRGRPFADAIAQLTLQHPDEAEAIGFWRTRWSEMFLGAIPETEQAIEALHRCGIPQFALTNMSAETWPFTQTLSPVFRHLGGAVVSAEEGVLKPDPRIYAIACERAGLEPQELLFIDDSAVNIEAARAFGLHGHLFDNPSTLHSALQAHGLL